MTWDEFTEARKTISTKVGLKKQMTLREFEAFLGLAPYGSNNWKKRNHFPDYAINSLEAHLSLSKSDLKKMYETRKEKTLLSGQ